MHSSDPSRQTNPEARPGTLPHTRQPGPYAHTDPLETGNEVGGRSAKPAQNARSEIQLAATTPRRIAAQASHRFVAMPGGHFPWYDDPDQCAALVAEGLLPVPRSAVPAPNARPLFGMPTGGAGQNAAELSAPNAG